VLYRVFSPHPTAQWAAQQIVEAFPGKPQFGISERASKSVLFALRDAILGLSAEQDIQELIRIWRRPGWTTPAEFLFASGLVDAMATQVDALVRMKTTLMKGSVAVDPG
jgi:hypothetical protein